MSEGPNFSAIQSSMAAQSSMTGNTQSQNAGVFAQIDQFCTQHANLSSVGIKGMMEHVDNLVKSSLDDLMGLLNEVKKIGGEINGVPNLEMNVGVSGGPQQSMLDRTTISPFGDFSPKGQGH